MLGFRGGFAGRDRGKDVAGYRSNDLWGLEPGELGSTSSYVGDGEYVEVGRDGVRGVCRDRWTGCTTGFVNDLHIVNVLCVRGQTSVFILLGT